MNRLSLVGQFAVRSFLFVALMALVLGVTISFAVRNLFVAESAKVAQVTANSIVLHYVGDEDIAVDAISPELTDSLDYMAENYLVDAGITTVKLWNKGGTLLYSSDRQNVGESFANHPPFVAALAGRPKVEIVKKPVAENEAQFNRYGRVIEVYAPLIRDGKTVGVFEIYQRYDPVGATINRFLMLMWGIILAGSIPAYFLQLTLVKRTADELLAAKGDLKEVNDRLTASLADMEMNSLGTLQALVAAVDAKDSYTARHSIAVTDYALAIARHMELPDEMVRDVERAGLLHDVGKIGTPEVILLKPERLTDDEFSVISEHSEMGGHIIESVPFLSHLMPVIRAHHERWDGNGYPDALLGDRIPVLARILMVADAFDAMTSERPYRTPVSIEVARAELVRCAGTQFDAKVVKAMLEALDAGQVNVVIHTEAARSRRGRRVSSNN